MTTLIINNYDSFYGCGVYIFDDELNIRDIKINTYFIEHNFEYGVTPEGYKWLSENYIDCVLYFDNGYLEYKYNVSTKEVTTND